MLLFLDLDRITVSCEKLYNIEYDMDMKTTRNAIVKDQLFTSNGPKFESSEMLDLC